MRKPEDCPEGMGTLVFRAGKNSVGGNVVVFGCDHERLGPALSGKLKTDSDGSLTGVMLLAACAPVPAPAPSTDPIAAPLPPPMMAPIIAPRPAPPPIVAKERVFREAPCFEYSVLRNA